MKNEKIVTINGQKFDSVSGMPIGKPPLISKPLTAHKPASASGIHTATQKSSTLYRRATQKPAGHAAPAVRKAGRSMDIARSNSVTHFGPRPVLKIEKPTITANQRPDIGPSRHPLAAKVDSIRTTAVSPKTNQPTATKPAKTIKEEAIAEAFAKLTANQEIEKTTFKRHKKHLNTVLITISLILLITIGYFIYINIPTLSIRVAGAQAGISATFPEYHPDGYSLNGPVSYGDGEVTIAFKSNTDNTQFSIKQVRSSWDSSAVKNQVDKDAGSAVVNTTTERGLTLYTYNSSAAWVNGGILYSITGDAHLSVDQIRRIATSL